VLLLDPEAPEDGSGIFGGGESQWEERHTKYEIK
jgi:hypothetical protein